MQKAKVVTLVAMVLNILLLGVLIFAVGSIALRELAGQGAAPPAPASAQGGDGASGDTAVPGAGDELDAWIANMKAQADRHGVSALFLQELFPDKIVYQFNGGTVYADIDQSLAQHSYNWDYFTPLAPPAEGEWKHDISAYNEPMGYDDGAGTSGIFGIDVSRYQGEIDWEKVKAAGVQYAFVRAGYRGYGNGEIQPDEMFESYMEGATEVGIPLGVYFFSQAITVDEALAEAEYVLEAIEGYDVRWPVVFDMEQILEPGARTEGLAPAMATDMTIAFCERIRGAGYTPMIYGNVGWMLGMLEQQRLGDYDKWFAQYRPFPWYPYEFGIWQYSHIGALDGIVGEVDFNISFEDYGAA